MRLLPRTGYGNPFRMEDAVPQVIERSMDVVVEQFALDSTLRARADVKAPEPIAPDWEVQVGVIDVYGTPRPALTPSCWSARERQALDALRVVAAFLHHHANVDVARRFTSELRGGRRPVTRAATR